MKKVHHPGRFDHNVNNQYITSAPKSASTGDIRGEITVSDNLGHDEINVKKEFVAITGGNIMNKETIKLKRAVIKEEFVAITGDFIKAVILNQFIYWSERMNDVDEYIKQENQRAEKHGIETQDLTYGWIYKTADELSAETMLNLKHNTMRTHIKELEKMGYICSRRNPKYKWDQTLQYRVDIVKVSEALNELGYSLDGYKVRIIPQCQKSTFECSKIDIPVSEIDIHKFENRHAIPETTTEITFKEKDISNKLDISKKKVEKKSTFKKPTADEVRDYCLSANINIDADRFIDFYESKGWKVGSAPMKDWKATVRNWSRRENNTPARTNPAQNKPMSSQSANKAITPGSFSSFTLEDLESKVNRKYEARAREMMERYERDLGIKT